jgi:hypothetical protein
MSEDQHWLWLVKTAKAKFIINVIGEWSQEEAAEKLHVIFGLLKLTIIEMAPRKLALCSNKMQGTIIQNKEAPAGIEFLAGKHIWAACGRNAEFEAEMILAKRRGKT